MAFQFISDTVILLLTYVKYLIIINYQSLKKAVFSLEVVIYNVYKCDVIITSSAAMNI